MRVSVWSSDVCSSDLLLQGCLEGHPSGLDRRRGVGGGHATSCSYRQLRDSTTVLLHRYSSPPSAGEPSQELADLAAHRVGVRLVGEVAGAVDHDQLTVCDLVDDDATARDRKSTRLNSSH